MLVLRDGKETAQLTSRIAASRCQSPSTKAWASRKSANRRSAGAGWNPSASILSRVSVPCVGRGAIVASGCCAWYSAVEMGVTSSPLRPQSSKTRRATSAMDTDFLDTRSVDHRGNARQLL